MSRTASFGAMRDNHCMTGQELRKRRLALGLPQARFGLLLGVSPANVHSWEAGRHPVPAWVADKLAEIEATRWPVRSPS